MCLYWIEAVEILRIFCVLTEDSRVSEMVGLSFDHDQCVPVSFMSYEAFFELIASVILENDSDFTE